MTEQTKLVQVWAQSITDCRLVIRAPIDATDSEILQFAHDIDGGSYVADESPYSGEWVHPQSVSPALDSDLEQFGEPLEMTLPWSPVYERRTEEDGFQWDILTNTHKASADELRAWYDANAGKVFELHSGTESLIEDSDHFASALNYSTLAIERGFDRPTHAAWALKKASEAIGLAMERLQINDCSGEERTNLDVLQDALEAVAAAQPA